ALLGAPDPDALAGREWTSILAAPQGHDAAEAGRAIASGGSWDGHLRFRYARTEVGLSAWVAPVARSSELMVMGLLEDTAPAPAPDAPPSAFFPEFSTSAPAPVEASRPVLRRDDLRALVAAYDAQHDLDDPTSIARAVLQAIETAIGFEWAAVLRYLAGSSSGLEVVATYPTPMAGVARGVRWTTLDQDEALVQSTGEPSLHGDLRRRRGTASPLN